MQERSKQMLAAGWVLKKISPTHWQVSSPQGNAFEWMAGSWTPQESELIAELKETEQAIRENRYSPFLGTCQLSASEHDNTAALLTQWLCQQKLIKGHSVLRARVSIDHAGDELLYAAGARRVETLLPPWPEAPHTHCHIPFHLLICEHVADVLPKEDRKHVLPRLITHLKDNAPAYFSFHQLDALPLDKSHRSFQDGYIFQQGPHEVFMKPTLPGRAAENLHTILGGFSEEINLLFNEIFCKWLPYD
ncbi:hypothetical protein P3T73_05945 [Kiritimatiellota bacterium B12222]|nr:hypothetical protein P3T73_05945 [Kiritimatiellota bacterium B12222]